MRVEFLAPLSKLTKPAGLTKEILGDRRWLSACLLASMSGKAQFAITTNSLPARFYLP